MATRTLPFVLLAIAGLAGAADAERTLMLCDFETPYDGAKWPPDGAGEVANSSEWKADGASSLRIDPGLTGVFDMTRQHDWTGYDTLRLKFNNPTQQTVAVGFELADRPAKGYWDRHQNGFGVPPGEHVIDLDLSGGLWRSEQNRPFRGELKTPIELDKITRFMIGNTGAGSIFVDSIELITVPKLACAGGFAFDFGRKEARVMGQFTGVHKETRYDASRGFGLTGDAWSLQWDMAYPTPMLGDSLTWSAGFRVDLPKGGKHIGIVAFERGGFWGSGEDTAYTKLTFSADGKPVHTHASRRDAIHFAFQDVEVTDATRIVDDIIFPATGWTRFAFDAQAGGTTFTVATEDTIGSGIRVSGLILAPDTAEGRAFLDAHEQLQRSSTFTMFTPQERGRRGDGRAKPAKDLVAAPLNLGEDVYPRDWPATAPAATAKGAEILAVRG
ncbi:MAG TPA: hypothetical protein VEL07_12845 [Planctomycetota bacterium]|nr:hypothetical protein [Planctomycetota bacterium]